LRRGGAKLTVSPTGEWMAQRARNLAWKLQDGALKAKFLLHDRHCKFTAGFNQVFRSEGVQVLRLPFRGPRANSIAERFVLTARRELLDHLLIFSARHLEAGDQGVLGPLSPGAPAPRSRTALPGPCHAGSDPIACEGQNCPPRPPRRLTPPVLLGRLIELTEALLRHRTMPNQRSWAVAQMTPAEETTRNRFGSFRAAIEAAGCADLAAVRAQSPGHRFGQR